MITKTTNIDTINGFLKHFTTSIKEIGVYSNYLIIKNKALLGYQKIYDRIEIDYLFVTEKCRRNGLASKLLNYLITTNKDDCHSISLEVNKNNLVAISFYQKHGFKVGAVREKYYGDTDGLLMVLEVTK